MEEIRNSRMKSIKRVTSSVNRRVAYRATHSKSDTEIIMTNLDQIMSNNSLLMKTLIASGVYDKNLKLTKTYK